MIIMYLDGLQFITQEGIYSEKFSAIYFILELHLSIILKTFGLLSK